MRNNIGTLAILLVIVFGMLSGAFIFSPCRADGTYIKDAITQNTMWTLLDSPIIIAKNVTVIPGVTLTIEPGVEVRFGGDFSLIVSGKLSAVGMPERQIVFTSNKEQKNAGDWGSIIFNGVEKSTLTNCVVQYGKDGIAIENGNVEIKDSLIRSSKNGINIVNGAVNIFNSYISDNYEAGISITGNGEVTISGTTILGNVNGILLTGAEVSNVAITGNVISANTQNGILFEAENHTDVTIVNNSLSSNNVGFCISTTTSTYLTNNSITYNNMGVLYKDGNHTAEYNDVYGNNIGMDVEAAATVNAEHNYWGDSTGPHHESLNPLGKGDKIGGDGLNLGFIPYLAKSISRVNTKPTASLLTDKVWVRPSDDVMFFATESFDSDGYVYQYRLSFGDGSNSGWTTLSVFAHKYNAAANYTTTLQVMDDNGAVSTYTAIVRVMDSLQPLSVNLELNNLTVVEMGKVNVTVYVTDGPTPVANATVKLFAIGGGEFVASTGQTDESGYFNTTFTAPDIGAVEKEYVRIVATASKNGAVYSDGSDHEYLEVLQTEVTEPENLTVEIIPESTQTFSGAQLNLTIRVMEDDTIFVEGANVTIEASNGTLSTASWITDTSGEFTLVFTAPMVNEPLNVTINANATKTGYGYGQKQIFMTVNPRTFSIEIIAPAVESGKSTIVTVIVKCNEDSSFVEGATVTMQSNYGNFGQATNTTDANGACTFIFNAPQTAMELSVIVIANIAKEGYMSTESQTTILATPAKAEGIPMTTLLLVIIPVAIVVGFVVLVKRGIIQISVEEKEGR